jgi:hypothetical protein
MNLLPPPNARASGPDKPRYCTKQAASMGSLCIFASRKRQLLAESAGNFSEKGHLDGRPC